MKGLQQLNNAIYAVSARFVRLYFPKEEFAIIGWEDTANVVVHVSDFYFGINDIYMAMKHEIPSDVLVDWYYYTEKGGDLNLMRYRQLGDEAMEFNNEQENKVFDNQEYTRYLEEKYL